MDGHIKLGVISGEQIAASSIRAERILIEGSSSLADWRRWADAHPEDTRIEDGEVVPGSETTDLVELSADAEPAQDPLP